MYGVYRLLQSGIEFTAAASPVNVFGMYTYYSAYYTLYTLTHTYIYTNLIIPPRLGLLSTIGYCWFLWRLNSRSLGPPEEGVGKRKDGGNMQGYGTLRYVHCVIT